LQLYEKIALPDIQKPKYGKLNLKTMSTSITGKTGETCQNSGVYKCQLHPSNTIPLSKGEKFPPCRIGVGGGHGTIWILVRFA